MPLLPAPAQSLTEPTLLVDLEAAPDFEKSSTPEPIGEAALGKYFCARGSSSLRTVTYTDGQPGGTRPAADIAQAIVGP